jgi:hypothetical protein
VITTPDRVSLPGHPRPRFWFEAVAATVSLIVGGLTLSRPNWIEIVFGVDPNRGSGLLEWLTVAVSVDLFGRQAWRGASGDAPDAG